MDDADPSTRGETGAESLNDAAEDAGPALRGAAIINEAFLGTEERDLSRAIAGLQKVTAALGRNEGTLQDFLENFNTTLAIFADEKSNVSASIRQLPGVLATADRTFASLNAAFPSTRAFAREILPGVRESDPTIQAAFPWIRQVRGLVGPDELQGLARDLRPAAADLAKASDAAIRFFPLQNLFARCLNEVILPTGDIKIVEPAGRKIFETGVENYKEFWYTMVGLAGESQNFDGNGQYVRFQPGGGTQTLSTGTSNSGSGQLFGNPPATPIGVRPVWRGDRPAYRPDVDCYKNEIPDINSARTGGPNFGQGPSSGPGAGDGTPPGSPSTPVGPTPALPQLPSLPPVGTAARARAASTSTSTSAAKPRAKASRSTATRTRTATTRSSSVTMELLSRLNPYRRGDR